MLVQLLILGFVAQAYGRPQEVSEDLNRIRVPDPRCLRAHQLLPHEYDCTKFYYCEDGFRFIEPRNCAPGTEFSVELEVCIHPSLANCTLPGVPTASPTTRPTAPSTTPTTLSTTTSISTTTTTTTTKKPETSSTTASTGAPSSPSTQNPSPGETLPNGCPADFGIDLLLPHEYDCGQYYQCVHGVKIQRPCAPGLHFNFTRQECLYPELANCTLTGVPTGEPSTEVTPTNRPSTVAPSTIPTAPSTAPTTVSTGAPSSPSTQNPSPGETLPNGCPADFGVDLLLPHECECGQYYQCLHGVKILRLCPPGLHFNFTRQECLYPELANCTLTGVPTGGPSTEVTPTSRPSTVSPTSIPTAPSTAPTTVSTSAPSSPSTQTPSPGETLPNGCPADFGVDLLLPHEYDCGQYYQCVHGVKIPRPCAAGLHFNFTRQECLYPELANCTLTGVPTGGPSTEVTPTSRPSTVAPTPIPTEPSTAPTTVSTGAPSPPSTQAPSPGETLPNGCPADFGVDLLLPHEYDCGLYYQCVHGVKILRPCAAGLHFNFTRQECLYPEQANCTLTGVPTGGPSTEVTPTNRPSTVAPTSIPTVPPTAPTTGVPTGGPPTNSTSTAAPTASPNTSTTGVPTGGPPTNSTSTAAPTASPNTSTTGVPTGPSTAPTTVSTGAPSSPSTQTPSPGETLPNGCPADFGVDLLLPHEYDCGLYYQCVHGVKILRPCSAGLHFNFTRQECLYPEQANCTLTGVPTGGPSTGVTPTNRPSTVAPTTIPTVPPTAPTTGVPTGGPSTNSTSTAAPTASPNTSTTGVPTGPSTAPTTVSTAAPSSPSTQAPSPGETLPNGCPADFGVDLLLPHEYDCGLYYQCVHGVKIPRPCAAGLHFNFTLQECLYPEQANCTLTGVPTGGPSTGVTPTNRPSTVAPTTIPTVPPTAPTTGVPTGGPPTNSTSTAAPTAPPTASTTVVPTEGPPTNSTSTAAPTAPPTAPTTGVPTGGPPTNSTSTAAPTAPSTAPTTVSTTTPPPDGGDGSDNKCKTGCNVPHWSHETDCDKFWHCNGDQKVLGVCSTGLHFNPLTQTCDFICNVACERKSVQTNYNADGLSVFLPWEKVDKFIELSNRGEIPNLGFDLL